MLRIVCIVGLLLGICSVAWSQTSGIIQGVETKQLNNVPVSHTIKIKVRSGQMVPITIPTSLYSVDYLKNQILPAYGYNWEQLGEADKSWLSNAAGFERVIGSLTGRISQAQSTAEAAAKDANDLHAYIQGERKDRHSEVQTAVTQVNERLRQMQEQIERLTGRPSAQSSSTQAVGTGFDQFVRTPASSTATTVSSPVSPKIDPVYWIAPAISVAVVVLILVIIARRRMRGSHSGDTGSDDRPSSALLRVSDFKQQTDS